MKKILNSKSGAGFTLLELILVISIIGILVSFLLLLINPLTQFQKARDGQRKSDLRQIQSALEMYRMDGGCYPTSLPTCGNPLYKGTVVNPCVPSTSGTVYIQKIPCDPLNTGQYTYRYSSNGTTYTLRTCLENFRDSQRDPVNDPSCTGGTTNWSYTLQNP